MELGGTSPIDQLGHLEDYGRLPFSYINDKEREKHYYDLDPEWALELKEIYADCIVRPNAEENSRPSVLVLDKRPKLWTFRRLLVERQRLDLHQELSYLEQAMEKDKKNYQLWHHRRWIVLRLGTTAASKELEFTEMLINEDANNFCAWNHRRWVLQALGGDWGLELAYCDTILEEDIYNSFVWDQRYFVVTRSPTLGGMEMMRDQEVDYALKVIATKPWSEYPWTYIKRLCADDSQSLVNNCSVKNTCMSVLQSYIDLVKVSKMEGVACVPANALNMEDVSACANALNMVWHLIKVGVGPSDKWIAVIEALIESDLKFAKLVVLSLQFDGCDVNELRSSIRCAGMSENRNLSVKRLRWGAMTVLLVLGLKYFFVRHRWRIDRLPMWGASPRHMSPR